MKIQLEIELDYNRLQKSKKSRIQMNISKRNNWYFTNKTKIVFDLC